ncbi:hypothetical protein K402DRAFT_162064 [Aulographum hederae CBS 113979]|uniref:Uncharacterized protein n=1 Tax=Aulographum hederae CBS 113979 TaxID=1176131 RepID=A0A6G1GS27_9PEZI|nr:hypothetical protein K402DRAFT_162064 [Aulographum hederae CBS 113979]
MRGPSRKMDAREGEREKENYLFPSLNYGENLIPYFVGTIPIVASNVTPSSPQPADYPRLKEPLPAIETSLSNPHGINQASQPCLPPARRSLRPPTPSQTSPSQQDIKKIRGFLKDCQKDSSSAEKDLHSCQAEIDVQGSPGHGIKRATSAWTRGLSPRGGDTDAIRALENELNTCHDEVNNVRDDAQRCQQTLQKWRAETETQRLKTEFDKDKAALAVKKKELQQQLEDLNKQPQGQGKPGWDQYGNTQNFNQPRPLSYAPQQGIEQPAPVSPNPQRAPLISPQPPAPFPKGANLAPPQLLPTFLFHKGEGYFYIPPAPQNQASSLGQNPAPQQTIPMIPMPANQASPRQSSPQVPQNPAPLQVPANEASYHGVYGAAPQNQAAPQGSN